MEKILAILVVYKELIANTSTYTSLLQSLTHSGLKLDLFIYDNSPEEFIQVVDLDPCFNVEYIRNTSNPGVSKAYNEGAAYASSKFKEWILILDQDTSFPITSIEQYLKSKNRYPQMKLFAPTLEASFGILSPGQSFLKHSSPSRAKLVTGLHMFTRKSLLNSGLLINISFFNEIGGYNENIPLDFSDTYFIEKVSKVINQFVLIDLICKHSLSSEISDYKTVLTRFKYYCIGAREYAKTSNWFLVYFWSFLRTVKLTIKFKRIDFLQVFLT